MTPIQTLGPFLSWLANDVQYRILREEVAKDGATSMVKVFKCPSCHVSMLYAHRHAHLVKQHLLHIGAVDAESCEGLNLAAVIGMISTSGSDSNHNSGGDTRR